jgi:hypothetical protein
VASVEGKKAEPVERLLAGEEGKKGFSMPGIFMEDDLGSPSVPVSLLKSQCRRPLSRALTMKSARQSPLAGLSRMLYH